MSIAQAVASSNDSAAPRSVATLLSSRQRLAPQELADLDVDGAHAPAHAQAVRFALSPDWQQGRTIFGGALALLAVQAMRDVVQGPLWPLRALQTHFVSPVQASAVLVLVQTLRQGKSARQVQARMVQRDERGAWITAAAFVGVFGAARTTSLPQMHPSPEPTLADAAQAQAWPFIAGVTPAFIQHLDYRQIDGGIPFTGTDHWDSRNHVRLLDPTGVDGELQSVMLADAGPTPALAKLQAMAPASSVSWSLDLFPLEPAPMQGHWRMDKAVKAAMDGYVSEQTVLWSPHGQLAAIGHQVVAVYG